MIIDDDLIREAQLESLSLETLLKVTKALYRNYMAIDGRWFQVVEEEFGTDMATRIDEIVWSRHAPVEAHRIKEALGINQRGIRPMLFAMNFCLWRILDYAPFRHEEPAPGKIVLTFSQCPIQTNRIKQGRSEFPCKKVGLIMLQNAAKVIDPSITVRCLLCPPDPHPDDVWCQWEFSIDEEPTPDTP